MHVKKNGYVAGAVLMIPFVKQFREHVEYEKFLCRMLVDNEQTQEFRTKTANLKDQLFALRYNSAGAERLTAAKRGKNVNNS